MRKSHVTEDCIYFDRGPDEKVGVENEWQLLQLSLQFSGFRVKARHLGHLFEEKVFMYQVF